VVAEVKAWLVAGQTMDSISEALAHHHPTADQTATLTAVAESLANDANTDPAALRGWALNAYREIYRRALELGDLAIALRAAKTMAEM